jgi:hypothetical protein
MDGIPVEEIKVTHEDVTSQLVKQLASANFDIAVLRAENEKLKNLVVELTNRQRDISTQK